MKNERIHNLLCAVSEVLTQVGMGWGDETMILPCSHDSKASLETGLVGMMEASSSLRPDDTETPTECLLIWCNDSVEAVSFGTEPSAEAKMMRMRERDYNETCRWGPLTFEEYTNRWRWMVTRSIIV